MNDRNAPDHLDQLLCQWAEEQAPAPADLKRMTTKIVQAVHEQTEEAEQIEVAGEPKLANTPVALERVRSFRWRTSAAVWFTLGAAAVLLLACGYAWLVPATDDRVPEIVKQAELPPAYAWLQDEQLRHKAVLLAEMDSIFDGKLNWLAETGSDVQVGLGAYSERGDAPAVAVRVVVQRRPVGQADWTVAWAIDVVARSEEVVRLVSETSGESKFAVWAYALPDGMIALDTDFNLEPLGAARATTSEVQPNGRPCEVLATQKDGFEFRVYQTAALLTDRLS